MEKVFLAPRSGEQSSGNFRETLVCQTLQKHLKNLGKQRNYHKKNLARLAGVANNTIVKIKGGKSQNSTLDTLKKIAKTLETSIDNLIS